ncbi:glycosyltransferase involved in cell wall biosynthesis [Paraburkholderia sp. GAS41]|uniref:glycosyltransferase n=1 Tax=Paraburkholderia sp. GAS41 TaxID=3035134 RepID=UPI003D23C92A
MDSQQDSFVSDAALLWPRHIFASSWHEHAPFAFWLVNEIQPRVLVELGTQGGFSYLALCQAIDTFADDAKCFGVDTSPIPTPAVRYGELDIASPYARFSSLIQSTVEEATQRFPDASIDLLHVHSRFEGPRAHTEFQDWLRKLSARGVVLLHGTSDAEKYPEIARIRAELTAQHASFDFDHGGGLTIVAVGTETPDALKRLIGLDPHKQRTVRATYGRLGKAISLTFANDARQQLISRQQETLQTHARDEQERASKDLVLHKLQVELARADSVRQELLNSTSWRVSAPVRYVGTRLNRLRVNPRHMRFFAGIVYRSIRTVGVVETMRKIGRHLSGLSTALGGQVSAERRIDPKKMPPPLRPATETLALRVLLIAEVSLPQCLKYRVLQKQEMIQALGIDCTVIKWSDYQACLDALQTHSVAIFYRVPGYPQVLELIENAKTLGVKTFWEVDDLIFDIQKYLANTNLQHLTPELRQLVLSGVPLYLSALKACDAGIASTVGIAKAMHDVGVKETHVIENGFDVETLSLADTLNVENDSVQAKIPAGTSETVRIVYGSGSKAHDADFLEAAPGLLAALKQHPHVELHIAGELTLPADFASVERQVFREPASTYPQYMRWLSQGDINIAPMENTEFNDAKSNIKYLEAAALKLPSVCSPRAAFATAITDGVDGYLADNATEWTAKLSSLIEDSTLRREMGNTARDHALAHYSMSSIMHTQVDALLANARHPRPELCILGVNIFYAPRSFGGATIVAEEMAKRLQNQDGVRFAMFTSASVDTVPPYQTVRYESDGVTVFGVGLPSDLRRAGDFENPEMHEPFLRVLRATRPDVVHIHCVQGIGATIIDVCKKEGVPVAVTLHDAWWICARQFMVTGANRYCNQVKIDLNVCAKCLGNDGSANAYRQHKLARLLHSADMLLAPSAFFRDLYIANGFDESKIVIDKNGVVGATQPREMRTTLPGGKLRFGFLGGIGPIKGYNLIKDVFSDLDRKDYELVLVDNALNLGHSSIHASQWKIKGDLKVIPAFTQATIDEFYARIDVLLFPTQWKESFGLAVREALIRDVWVVATDGGGVVEDITPGVNGDVIPLADDGTALKRSIIALLEDKDRFIEYRNPHASEIRVFDTQSEHLLGLLRQVARRVDNRDESASSESEQVKSESY